MVLLKFKKQEDSDSFYQEFNGRPFNSFDPEECKLVFVSHVKIETQKGLEVIGTPTTSKTFELPSCPVCLEFLDAETSGIVTTICNHTFHCDCLSKWGEATCPCCRYDPEKSESTCFICDTKKNLWICLLCGNIGCSRYSNGHANEHFEKTGHTFALEIETKRVWDYVGDGYVHRLISHKEGDLVEYQNIKRRRSTMVEDELQEVEYQHKMDFICQEYNQLLAQQLESQRVYFEKIIRDLKKENEEKIERLKNDFEELDAEHKRYIKKTEQNQKGKVKTNDSESHLLKELNERLIQNQKELKEKLELREQQLLKISQEKDKKIIELEDQVKDIMFYLETQKKVENSPNKESIQSGTLLVTQKEEPPKRKKKSGPKR